jgi:hypothetical protein
MNKPMKSILLMLGLLLALNAASNAQGPPPEKRKPWGKGLEQPPGSPGERRGPPDWGRRPGPEFGPPSFEMFSDNKTVKGAPYSATAITETVQTLADGARITHKKTDTIYRDSEGRTRREQTFDRVGPFQVEGEPRQIIFINDVVAGARVVLDPGKLTARKMPSFDRPAPRFTPRPPADGAERKTESLGKQTIEGVEAEGTRTTTTIPAGKIGNDRPLEIVSERWESPELQVVVLSKHKDPFAGETTYRLTNISRDEPARSLFEVPASYTLESAAPPMRSGRPPRQ